MGGDLRQRIVPYDVGILRKRKNYEIEMLGLFDRPQLEEGGTSTFIERVTDQLKTSS
jgi:hypothetical protein